MKILVVDDSDIDRKLLISTIEKSGIKNEFIQADNGQAALDILESQSDQICLIFLDWQLPKVDGLEILKKAAQNPKWESLPIIMLTSSSNPESREIAHLLNPNLKDFIMKPLVPDNIIGAALPHIK